MPEIIVKLGESIVHRYFFDKDILNIGRARDNDIVIENLAVSRNHARIRRVDAKFILSDLNSANGTFVNGVRVTKTEVINNDVITVGKHNLYFLDVDLTEEQIISDAFGSERTMIIDRAPLGVLTVTKGKQKGQEFKINKYETFLGRASRNDIQLHDWFVSRKHAVIMRQGGKFFIKDLGSWRKIILNGQLIKEAELSDGDEIQLGSTHLTFHVTTQYEVPQLEGRPPKELAAVEETVPQGEEMQPVGTETQETELVERLELKVGTEQLKEETVTEEKPVEEEVSLSVEEIPELTSPEEEKEEAVEVAAPAVTDEAKSAKAGTKKKAQKIGKKKEIAMWERALENRSPVIRKEALRMLKQLTGKNYEVEEN